MGSALWYIAWPVYQGDVFLCSMHANINLVDVLRSATLCIAYLVKHEGMTLREAYRFVKQARPIIRPNHGFWLQLIAYEEKLRGMYSYAYMSGSKFLGEGCKPEIFQSTVKFFAILG